MYTDYFVVVEKDSSLYKLCSILLLIGLCSYFVFENAASLS